MKYLTLVRHAAAVHDSSYRDFDRPLRDKGQKKAASIAEIMDSKGYKPDLLLSSPAVRALETAEIYKKESKYGSGIDEIVTDQILYLPSPGDILDCVRKLDDSADEVFIYSHNNGISWAAQEFCNDSSILMPTGSAVRIEFNIDSWNDAVFGRGRRLEFFP